LERIIRVDAVPVLEGGSSCAGWVQGKYIWDKVKGETVSKISVTASFLLAILIACGGAGGSSGVNETTAPTTGSVTFQLEVWADNWFAAYLGSDLLVEDSASITTERSFNAERVIFDADYPLHLNFVLKDFMEDDSGLEYIGERNQQMGDGGFIMQLTETESGTVVAVSSQSWACTVIHQAPLDKTCQDEDNPVPGEGPCGFISLDEPADWKGSEFDDSQWISTTVHSERAVDPKHGYEEIDWDPRAELIWGPDLETDNTLLCRITVNAGGF
jgi:hypothetical protein